jgi:hypothetical protein
VTAFAFAFALMALEDAPVVQPGIAELGWKINHQQLALLLHRSHGGLLNYCKVR